MFETAGTLTIVELASSLVALVLLPLLWAAVALVAVLRRSGSRFAVRVAIATSGGTFGLAVAHAMRASQLPAGHVAEQHVAQLARIGQLDVAFDLVRDPTSATFAVLVAFMAFASVLHAVWTVPSGIAARLAWTGLAASAPSSSSSRTGCRPSRSASRWRRSRVGRWRAVGVRVPSVSRSRATLPSCSSRGFSSGRSAARSGRPGTRPTRSRASRSSRLPDAPRADAKATVSLTTYEDALVSSDDGPPLPGEPLRAPFTLTLDPGNYSFRIQAGAATTDLLVTHVTLAAGRSYVLTPYGPTTSFRNLDDQLAVPRPTPTGPSSMRQVLAARIDRGAAAADRARHHRRSRRAAPARAPDPDRPRRPRVRARRRPARRARDAHRAARRPWGRRRALHRARARRGGARGLRRRLAISRWRRTDRARCARVARSHGRPAR